MSLKRALLSACTKFARIRNLQLIMCSPLILSLFHKRHTPDLGALLSGFYDVSERYLELVSQTAYNRPTMSLKGALLIEACNE